jgi:hypothetical protein
MILRRCKSMLLFGMTKQITLRFVDRTLLRLKHVTKIEPNGLQTLAYVLVKNQWGYARVSTDDNGQDPENSSELAFLAALQELKKDQQQAHDGDGPKPGAQPRDTNQIDNPVGDACPEEQLRAKCRHRVCTARHLRNQDKHSKQDETFEHIVMRALRSARPTLNHGKFVAIPGKRRQSDLQHCAEYSNEHLDKRQSG